MVYFPILYIYHKNQPQVGKYTSPMDGMGDVFRVSHFFAINKPGFRWVPIATSETKA